MLPAACAAPCATACAATSTQPQRADRIVFHAFNRAHTYKQHAGEIAPLVEMQRKMNSVKLGAACGPRPAACPLRSAAKYEPALSEPQNVQVSVFQNLCSC